MRERRSLRQTLALLHKQVAPTAVVRYLCLEGRGCRREPGQYPAAWAVRLLGGVIQYYYGAFALFSSPTGQMINGYSRQFAYDPRMQHRLPPHFPTTGMVQLSVATPLSFGQREQVY